MADGVDGRGAGSYTSWDWMDGFFFFLFIPPDNVLSVHTVPWWWMILEDVEYKSGARKDSTNLPLPATTVGIKEKKNPT